MRALILGALLLAASTPAVADRCLAVDVEGCAKPAHVCVTGASGYAVAIPLAVAAYQKAAGNCARATGTAAGACPSSCSLTVEAR